MSFRKILLFAGGAFLLAAFAIALFPERPGKLLTPFDSWKVLGTGSSKVLLSGFSEQYRQVRRSAIESPGGMIFRTWTPESGVVPLEVTSAPFRPTRYMSVAITGTNRTTGGLVQAFLECESNGQRLEIFRGSVNVNVAESIVVSPTGWCSENARLKLVSGEKHVNVGVGAVFEVSRLSYLKSTLIGRIPYLVAAFLIFALPMVAGASVATRLGWSDDPLPVALASLGIAALGAFYIASILPPNLRWIGASLIAVAALVALILAGREVRSRAAVALLPYAQVWSFASLGYFAILGLANNGVGHWEPNYRFWPAIWSSDNELPWLVAEAIRRGWDLPSLFGGGWLPTDRPPLMAGAHLLLADVFRLLQSANDGVYLRGHAYNAAAIALNALWVPACAWLLVTLRSGVDHLGRTAILVLIGCLPFVLFNTIYGWPKVFGAAFALVAFGIGWQSREHHETEWQNPRIVLFFVLAAFSMLAHASTALFLLPLGLLVLWWTVRISPRGILTGLVVAFALLASWSVYKAAILPSADPVTKFALTGDYGFGRPAQSIWQMLHDRYSAISLWQWLTVKKTMLLQSFVPVHHSITQIQMNADSGVGVTDRLRAWDFLMLSKGNLAIPVLIVAAIWASLRAFSLGNVDAVRAYAPFLAAIGVSVVAWLLMVLAFFAPAIVHHWPFAALFALALGGAVIVYRQYPSLFAITLVGVISYTGLVWIVSPLHAALHLDAGAALVLLLIYSCFAVRQLLPEQQEHGRSPTRGPDGLQRTLAGLRANRTFRRLGNAGVWRLGIRGLAMGALCIAAYVTLRFIHQPLADVHAFRQTQTALTSYWMLKEGWALAYQTPVAGYPWSIPFEFPIYQALVAILTAFSGFELEAVGRFVSFLFLLACAGPAFAISRRLRLPSSVPWVFCALLWTSPLSVYWGRTFMIETAALFFSFASIPFGIDLIRREGSWRSAALFALFATAGVLQKATTGGPVLLFLVLAALLVQVRRGGISVSTFRALIYPTAIFSVPLVIGLAWTEYTDFVKAQNPLGAHLTAQGLSTWNFGTLDQKFSFGNWRLLIWERSFLPNAAGLLGVVLLLLPWIGRREDRDFGWVALAATGLFVLPMLIFTNVHVAHEYYQVASVPFLIAALAVVIGGWLPKVSGVIALTPIVTTAVIGSNLLAFGSAYGIVVARSLSEMHPRSIQSYTVGQYLREHTKSDSGIVIFGQDWSSEMSFQAQRKSMTAPIWFKDYMQVWKNPRAYLGDLKLGAIVVCPSEHGFPNSADVRERLSKESGWRLERVMDCEIILRIPQSKDGLRKGSSSVASENARLGVVAMSSARPRVPPDVPPVCPEIERPADEFRAVITEDCPG